MKTKTSKKVKIIDPILSINSYEVLSTIPNSSVAPIGTEGTTFGLFNRNAFEELLFKKALKGLGYEIIFEKEIERSSKDKKGRVKYVGLEMMYATSMPWHEYEILTQHIIEVNSKLDDRKMYLKEVEDL